jgi:hypothetical protein
MVDLPKEYSIQTKNLKKAKQEEFNTVLNEFAAETAVAPGNDQEDW